MIVDDHAMFRRGIEIALKIASDVELVGETDDGHAAIRLCEEVNPDVILMDMRMADMDGVTATRIIRQQFPRTKVIALSNDAEETMVSNAIQAGAIGYLVKTILPHDLIQAIRAAVAGRVILSPDATEALVRAATRPPKPDYGLTLREMEVLHALKEGHTNNTIAEKLVISPATVKHHISNILNKLQVSSRMEAVVMATRKRLI
ncbi:MAG: response regulator transcription factor [Litorilinea sp.]